MLPQKKFSTFSEQVEWLQDEKHLIISDKQYAEDVLKHIGYFPLMGGYKHLFRIPLTKKYTDGTSRIVLQISNAADLTQIYAGQSFSVLMAGYSFFHQSYYNSVLPLSLHFADTLRSHKTSASFQEAAFPFLRFCYDLYRIQIFFDIK